MHSTIEGMCFSLGQNWFVTCVEVLEGMFTGVQDMPLR